MKIRAAAIWSMVGVSGLLGAACAADTSIDPTPGPVSSGTPDATPHKPDASKPDAAPDAGKPDATPDAQPDATTDAPVDASLDTKPDAPDAAKDGAVDAPKDVYDPVGSKCTPEGTVEARPCGVCGKQQRLCLGAIWQDWGSCSGEVPNGCTPGTTDYVGCGMCGQLKRECTSMCTWMTGICSGEPANACEPGLLEYSDGLSCASGTGRTRECSKPSAAADGGVTGCTWSNYSTACVAPLTSLIAPAIVGEKVGGVFVANTQLDYVYENYYSTPIDAAKTLCMIDTTYPYKAPGTFVKISNPSTSTVTLSIWMTEAKSGTLTNADVAMAVFPGGTIPTNLGACGQLGEACYSGCTGMPKSALAAVTAGTIGGAPTIAPGGEIMVYLLVDDYYAPKTSYDVGLFVKTESVK